MNVGQKLKSLRSDKKMTQKELADMLNISRTTYVKYETNDIKLSLEKASAIAKIFDVSTDYLLDSNGNLPEKQPKRPKDLMKILEQEEYTLNGQIASQEDREKLAKIVEALYWDAKEKNKRKK